MAVLSFMVDSPLYSVLFLQEPWLSSSGSPPSLPGFQLFTPSGGRIRCATYVRLSSNLQPALIFQHLDSFLGVSISLGDEMFSLYNFYSPGHPRAAAQLFESFVPARNCLLMGDFNAHHPLWYGYRQAEYESSYASVREESDLLVARFQEHAFTLHNVPGLFTFYPRNGQRSTIIDLTLSSGTVTDSLSSWSLGDSFGSDHCSMHVGLQTVP